MIVLPRDLNTESFREILYSTAPGAGVTEENTFFIVETAAWMEIPVPVQMRAGTGNDVFASANLSWLEAGASGEFQDADARWGNHL